MLITNQTAVDYWFGPMHLLAGIGQTLTLDDTTDTSLYLTDDDVADAVNTLYLSGMITVTSYNTPFPRPTGTPQVLHGDGSPNGLVYATQGSLYMRRDNTSASDTLYVKITGVESNTGWAAISLAASTTGATFPASPAPGQIFMFVSGQTELQFTYDGSHWYSETISVPLLTKWSSTFSHANSGSDNVLYAAQEGVIMYIADVINVGCTVQLRVATSYSNNYPTNNCTAPMYRTASQGGGWSGQTICAGTNGYASASEIADYSNWATGPSSGALMMLGWAWGIGHAGGGCTGTWYEVTCDVRYVK